MFRWQLIKFENDYTKFDTYMFEFTTKEEVIAYISLTEDIDYDEAYILRHDEYTIHGGITKGYYAPCRICEELREIYCDVRDFDINMHYCGGSPRCCP